MIITDGATDSTSNGRFVKRLKLMLSGSDEVQLYNQGLLMIFNLFKDRKMLVKCIMGQGDGTGQQDLVDKLFKYL